MGTNSATERTDLAILHILEEAQEPLGARVIGRLLKERGVDLTERAVRYHLQELDARDLTKLVGRDGRRITRAGVDEAHSARVADKVGFALAKIEALAYQTTFDPVSGVGDLPVNLAFFPRRQWQDAVDAMRSVFATPYRTSALVCVAREGDRLGGATVPPETIGLVTVCSITTNAALLKAGVPMDSRFGGILELREGRPSRFVEMIAYAGSSLDPSEVFIRGGMTSAGAAAGSGRGRILANFREIPAVCLPRATRVLDELRAVSIEGALCIGEPGEPVCEIPVGTDRCGIVLPGGLNPVAAAVEAGIAAEVHAMTGMVAYAQLAAFGDLSTSRLDLARAG